MLDNSDAVPVARTDRLIVRELDGETLIYDCDRDTAACLNEAAAKVWRLCDGRITVAGIADRLDYDERAVWLALEQLTKSHLLLGPIALPKEMRTARSRREVVRALGLGAAVMIPIVTSITVPVPAQAQSCFPAGSGCTVNGQCCSMVCLVFVCT